MLKKRLENVANLIDESTLIDVGTDHGYLLIDLIKKNIINKGLAVEISQGPLDNVMENVKKHDIEMVDFALSDGLTNVEKEVSDLYSAISICGMGGKLIADIITDSIDKFKGKTLYLQPNNGEQILRECLAANGFAITYEEVLIDNDIFYEIIKAIPGEMSLTDAELYFGPYNYKHQSKQFKAKYEDRIVHLKQIEDKLIKNKVDSQHITSEIRLIEEL